MIKVAVGIITINSQVLVCQRKKTSRYGLKWEFPGGKLKNGESVEHCLHRELLEELSINAIIGEEFFRQHWLYPDSGSFEVFYHLVPSYSGTLRNNVFEQIRWAHFSELARIDMLEGNREVISQLRTQNEKLED
jgi:mutator protein MutT